MTKAGPEPVFRSRDEVCSQWVSLDIADDGVEVIIGLDRKSLEASLIEWAESYLVVPPLPSQGMQAREVMNECREVAVALRPQHHMPVVRHETETANPHGTRAQCLQQIMLKRLVLVRARK